MSTIVDTPALLHRPTVPSVARTDDRDVTRSERIGFWMYVAMGSFCVAVLVAAAMSALVS